MSISTPFPLQTKKKKALLAMRKGSRLCTKDHSHQVSFTFLLLESNSDLGSEPSESESRSEFTSPVIHHYFSQVSLQGPLRGVVVLSLSRCTR